MSRMRKCQAQTISGTYCERSAVYPISSPISCGIISHRAQLGLLGGLTAYAVSPSHQRWDDRYVSSPYRSYPIPRQLSPSRSRSYLPAILSPRYNGASRAQIDSLMRQYAGSRAIGKSLNAASVACNRKYAIGTSANNECFMNSICAGSNQPAKKLKQLQGTIDTAIELTKVADPGEEASVYYDIQSQVSVFRNTIGTNCFSSGPPPRPEDIPDVPSAPPKRREVVVPRKRERVAAPAM